MSEWTKRGNVWEHALWRIRTARAWLAWVRQGRPRDEPVILVVGKLEACPHGKGNMTGWGFDSTRQDQGPIDLDEYWERMSARYPVERIPYLEPCTFCAVTA